MSLVLDFPLACAALAQEWSASAPGSAADLLAGLGRLLGAVLLLLLSIYLLHAWRVRRRYRAVDALGPAERRELQAGIEAVERRTRGELFVVCLERSDRHPAAEWIAGVTTALLLSGLLAGWLPWERPALLLGCQAGFGLLGFLTARALPDFKRRFVSPARATEMAEEQAWLEFFRHGLHRTEERIGVLLFVSLFEHRVLVLADEGIAVLVPPELWAEVDDAVLAGARRGSLGQGLEEGIRMVGEVLAEHFPLDGADRDELPDHVVVRSE